MLITFNFILNNFYIIFCFNFLSLFFTLLLFKKATVGNKIYSSHLSQSFSLIHTNGLMRLVNLFRCNFFYITIIIVNWRNAKENKQWILIWNAKPKKRMKTNQRWCKDNCMKLKKKEFTKNWVRKTIFLVHETEENRTRWWI